MTFFHSKFFAYDITKQISSDSIAKLSPSLFNASVDLNPHQLDAALFAFRSPLSRGAILADEVGLGKTIEAGIVISQLWAERKRKILIIAPSTLRKQWAQELADKFYISSRVFDSREFNSRLKSGIVTPLELKDEIAICSYNFVQSREADFVRTKWDLVVIDEAHRLRNVYKPGNKIATAIKRAFDRRPKILLTATPLQNSLLELFGLVSFLDEHLFGDVQVFRERYMRGALAQRELSELRQRLKPICQRTLRRQVTEYVRFTNRIPITQDFTPSQAEQDLYDQVSAYLQREKLNALPAGQRQLMTLILRKLLASSSYAIAGTLKALAQRLRDTQKVKLEEIEETFETEFEGYEEIADEWKETETDNASAPDETANDIQEELDELTAYGELASSIRENAKGTALVDALKLGFEKLEELGANRKAVIFTESRRTQEYLIELLTEKGYGGRAIMMNGTNSDKKSAEIYKDWVKRHKGEPVVSGSKPIDIRAAIVENFRDTAEILVATEAAAEGVNLQFCSLVVNFDLPWNPQRIEQRIGRCHRYGQKHDVVVINFLNRKNAADQRVFDLLSEKFKLFDGVFGSSDEILGALESGVDFEKRIAAIYQTCRTTEEIEKRFNELQGDLEEQIVARMADTRRDLMENFDEEVHQRLRMSQEDSKNYLNQFERSFWTLTKTELAAAFNGSCEFDEEFCEFKVPGADFDGNAIEAGRYRFLKYLEGTENVHGYTLNHPLAEYLIKRAKGRDLPASEIVFNYSGHQGQIGIVKDQIGNSGWLCAEHLKIESLEAEDRILFSVFDDGGKELHPDFAEKLFQVAGVANGEVEIDTGISVKLENLMQAAKNLAVDDIALRNSKYFDDELEKIDRWADDLKYALEMQLKDLDTQIRQLKRDAKLVPDLQAKLDLHKRLKETESERSKKRRELYEAQDEIEFQKDKLILDVESRLTQKIETKQLFAVRWKVT
ncbi:MAG: SNF2-related protein [Pyrinomonadaceae bacterium]